MYSLGVFLLLVSFSLAQIDPDTLLTFSISQTQSTIDQVVKQNGLGSKYPSASIKLANGKQEWGLDGAGSWTSGHWPGILWQVYNYTKDSKWLPYALKATEGMSVEQHNTGTHDVGFMIFYSFGIGYEVTKNQSYLTVLETAAKSLSQRYSPIVGCIRSWNGPHFQVIIDNMMNLELLWWVSTHGGNKTYFDMAVSHSDHMIRDCIKPDGSSYHLIDYDPNTGAVLSKSNTPQGMAGGVWARGEAWALSGFTKAYKYSQYPRYLDEAQKVADYFLSHLPSNNVPYWDFLAPQLPTTSRDTSAASIAASALLELSTYVTGTKGKTYRDAAERILSSLATAYLGHSLLTDAILLDGCVGDGAPMVSLIYGDYYFVEALTRLAQK